MRQFTFFTTARRQATRVQSVRPSTRRREMNRPRLEGLESRRLLAAEGGTIVFDPASFGSVTVTGTDANDVIRAERVGTDDVRFTVNSTTQTFDLDDFGTISSSGARRRRLASRAVGNDSPQRRS